MLTEVSISKTHVFIRAVFTKVFGEEFVPEELIHPLAEHTKEHLIEHLHAQVLALFLHEFEKQV